MLSNGSKVGAMLPKSPPTNRVISSTSPKTYYPENRRGSEPAIVVESRGMPSISPGRPISREARIHRLRRVASAGTKSSSSHGHKSRILSLGNSASVGYTGPIRVHYKSFDSDFMVVDGRLFYDDCLRLWGGIIDAEFRRSKGVTIGLLHGENGEILKLKNGVFDGIEDDGCLHTYLIMQDNDVDLVNVKDTFQPSDISENISTSSAKEAMGSGSLDDTSLTVGLSTKLSDELHSFEVAHSNMSFEGGKETSGEQQYLDLQNEEYSEKSVNSQTLNVSLPSLNKYKDGDNDDVSESIINENNFNVKEDQSERPLLAPNEISTSGVQDRVENSQDNKHGILNSHGGSSILAMPILPDLPSPRPHDAERVVGCGTFASMVLNSDPSRRKVVFLRQPTSLKQLRVISTKVLGLEAEGKMGLKFLDGSTGQILQPGEYLQRDMQIFVCVDKDEPFSGTAPEDMFWDERFGGPPPNDERDQENDTIIGEPLRELRNYLLDHVKPMVKRDRTKINWDAANNNEWRGLTIDRNLGVITKFILPCVDLDIDIDILKPLLGQHLEVLYLAGNVHLRGDLGITGRQCPNLRILNLNHTGIQGDIECLRGLTALKVLDITGCTHITGVFPHPLAQIPDLEYHLRHSGVMARITAAEQREWLFGKVKLKIEALLYWKQFAKYELPKGKGSQFLDYGNVNWEIESFSQWYGITFLAGPNSSAAIGTEKMDRPGFYVPDEHFAGQCDLKTRKVSEYEHGDTLGEGLVSKIWLPKVGLHVDIGPDFRPLYTEHLVVLNLRQNPDTSGDILAIGERCPRLEVLNLGRTNCYGDIATLSGCVSLKELDIENCLHIKGSMPATLLRIQGLEFNIEGSSVVVNQAAQFDHGLFEFNIIETNELLDLDRFEPYEEATARLKVVVETYQKCRHWRFTRISGAKKKRWNGNKVEDKLLREEIGFVSHRWLSSKYPDDDKGSKLKHLQMLARQHPEIRAWWIDFLCVPQKMDCDTDIARRRAAMLSVAHYINCCGTFFVLIDNTHDNPRYHMNGREGWNAGGWTRIERLAASVTFLLRDRLKEDKPLESRVIVSHAQGCILKSKTGTASTNGAIEETIDLRHHASAYDPALGKFSDDEIIEKPDDQKDRNITKNLRDSLFDLLSNSNNLSKLKLSTDATTTPAGFVPQEVQGESTEARVTGGHYDSDEEDGGIMPFEDRKKPDPPLWWKEILQDGCEKIERWEIRTMDKGDKFKKLEEEREEKWRRVL